MDFKFHIGYFLVLIPLSYVAEVNHNNIFMYSLDLGQINLKFGNS
jgi:hypothetical protein